VFIRIPSCDCARLPQRLPPEICQLSKLTSLFLEGNYLKALPSEIGELSALTSMRLNNNRLTMLPSEIGRLSALHTLAAASNMIEVGRPPCRSLNLGLVAK
jgi:Leucine-rich repeat (LRR) protein